MIYSTDKKQGEFTVKMRKNVLFLITLLTLSL